MAHLKDNGLAPMFVECIVTKSKSIKIILKHKLKHLIMLLYWVLPEALLTVAFHVTATTFSSLTVTIKPNILTVSGLILY